MVFAKRQPGDWQQEGQQEEPTPTETPDIPYQIQWNENVLGSQSLVRGELDSNEIQALLDHLLYRNGFFASQDPADQLLNFSYTHPVNSTLSREQAITSLNFHAGVRDGLAAGIADGRLDAASVLRLIEQAYIEANYGASFSPAGAALYALAYANAQGGDNWERWEDDNAIPVIYFGSSGAFARYGNVLGGGNCTNFVSMALLAGGAEPSNIWNLGTFDTRHTNPEMGRDNALYSGYYAGSMSGSDRPFTGVSSIDQVLNQSRFGSPSISEDIVVTDYLLNYNVSTAQLPERREEALNNLGIGDLIVSRDRTTSSDHLSMVVGWGAPESALGQPFYPSINAAQAAGEDTSGWVPYIIDHGGLTPESYPRPWTEGVTTSVDLATDPDIKISLINLEPNFREP